MQIADQLISSAAVDIVVVDSVAALTPKKEIEGDMGDNVLGLQARLMSQALRKLTSTISKTNIIHCPIGKASFGPEKLAENFNALMGAVIKATPAAAKGQYVRSCVVVSTMGPGVKVNASKL